MLCKSCNTTNASTAKFCINCGLQLDSAVAAQEVKSPEWTKHAKAAIASKAEIEKWEKVRIIDAIAFISSLVIAWFSNSWIIAIAGLIICSAVGGYATSKKEKARQDTLDHINRADGMSEASVKAARGRREAEIALALAIIRLDEASSKLGRASTYEEKTKAEAEVVSAKAAIERAKLMLQHATARENSESQKSKQNERLSTVQEIQFNQKSIDNEFAGEKTLTNDGYKIYLVKKYKIEKMDVLGKFACGERLFETIEEALNFADSLENQTVGKSAATLPVPTQSVTANPEKKVAQETDNPPQNVRPQNTKHKKNKNALPIILGVAVIGAAVFWQMGTETERTTEKKDTVKPFTTKPYSQLRTEMGKEGWRPYIARDNKDQCDLKYQEVSFCSEDLSCTAEFVDGSNKQIATINFRICKSVINNCVSWGEYPDGFELVVSKELKSLNTPVETYPCGL